MIKLFEKIKEDIYREVRIMGFPLFVIKNKHSIKFFTSLENIFYKKILKLTQNKYKHIIIFRSATGDIAFLRMVFDALKEKYGIKDKVLVVSKRGIYEEIFKIYNFDVDFLRIDFCFLFSNTLKDKKYKNTYFHIFHDYKFLSSLYKKKRISTITNEWCKNNQIKREDVKNIKANYTVNLDDLQYKLKDLNLDFSNFVFFAFDGGSLESLSEAFTSKITKEFNKKGYDIFFNTKKTPFGKCKLLNYNDTLALASLAKYIVTLRSGLSDILASTNTKQFVIYNKSKTKGLSSTRVKEIWTFSDLENTRNSNFIEYDLAQNNEDEVIKNIIGEI